MSWTCSKCGSMYWRESDKVLRGLNGSLLKNPICPHCLQKGIRDQRDRKQEEEATEQKGWNSL